MVIPTYKNILNIRPGSIPVVVHLSQGDVGRILEFYLYDGSAPVYPDSYQVSVHGVRQDGMGFGPHAVTTTSGSNLVKVEVTEDMTAIKGAVLAELTITGTDESVSTANFAMLVESGVFPNAPVYSTDISVYQQILAYVQGFPADIRADYNTKITALQNSLSTEISNRTAAEAAINARIDNIITPSGDPSLTELADIRVGADGTNYASAGTAVRGQVTDLTNQIYTYDAPSTDTFTIIKGGLSTTGADLNGETYLASRRREQRYIPYVQGSVIMCDSAYDMAIYFYSGTTVSTYISNTGYIGSTCGTPYVSGAKYIRLVMKRVDGQNFEDSEIPTVTYIKAISRIEELEGLKPVVEENVSGIKRLNDISAYTTANEDGNLCNVIVGHYYASAVGEIKDGGAPRIGMSEYIPCDPDTDYVFSLFNSEVTTTTDFYVAWRDSSGTFIRRDNVRRSAVSSPSITLTSPSNAAFMNFSVYNTTQISESSKLQIEKGTTKSADYIPPYTATDWVARKQIADGARSYPEYYDEEVTATIDAARMNMGIVGVNGDSFVFITDPHWGINAAYSPALIKAILDKTNIRQVVCGGDALDSGTKVGEMAKGYAFMDAFSYLTHGLKYVVGNHDGNKNGHVDDTSYWLTSEQIYALFYPQVEDELHDVHCTEGIVEQPTVYCYFDVPASKTRYLIIGSPFGSIPNAEMDWITAQLDDNPDKNIVIFAHYLYNPSTGDFTTAAKNLLNRCSARTNVRAIVYGHIHADLVRYTSTGIPVIASDTDAYDRLGSLNPNTAERGTVTEHAFDTMTVDYRTNTVYCARLGRGKDRKVNGGVNSVALSGNITLISSLTSPAWASSDTTVATVSDGVVTGVAAGAAIITAITDMAEEYWYIVVS